MAETDLQKELFVFIENALASHISMIDAIADLMNIIYEMLIVFQEGKSMCL